MQRGHVALISTRGEERGHTHLHAILVTLAHALIISFGWLVGWDRWLDTTARARSVDIMADVYEDNGDSTHLLINMPASPESGTFGALGGNGGSARSSCICMHGSA